jgi:pyruvate dehydrogenase E2 component (dihydrolipoamide acetyltransferase)
MAYTFRLPDVGEGIAEAEIVRWLVHEGEAVTLDQPLLEIQTDKAIVEVPAPVAGVIGRLGGAAGDILHVGELLVTIEEPAGSHPSPNEARPAAPGSLTPEEASGRSAPPQDDDGRALTPHGGIAGTPSFLRASGRAGREDAGATPDARSPSGGTPEARPLATPAVRKLARELGVDLAMVPANGPNGRITAGDVQAFAAATRPSPPHDPQEGQPLTDEPAQPAAAVQPAVGRPRSVLSSQSPALGRSSALTESSVLSPESSTREPLRGLRRRIAETMAESWRTIPHISGHDEIDVSGLISLRERLQPAAEAAGVHLTYLPFVIKAAVAALKRYPIANAQLDAAAGEIVYRQAVNVGIATATPDGLIVPVIHNADRKSLRELQAEISELSAQARGRRISLAALQGGTFTITNFGSLGGWLGTAIIRPGEAAILGVGRIDQRPWVVEGRIEPRPVMPLSLSADHRLIDGDVSTGFLRAVAACLTDPLSLFLEMA